MVQNTALSHKCPGVNDFTNDASFWRASGAGWHLLPTATCASSCAVGQGEKIPLLCAAMQETDLPP